ncbi:MAG: hypothetical protein V3V00_10945 [Saprospiraceae bacterium]
MKNALLILGLISTLVMMSCSSEIGITDASEEIAEEQKTGSSLEIQNTSLVDINNVLTKIGVESFSLTELESKRSTRDNKSCINAKYKSDINGDQIISIADLVNVFDIIREYDNISKFPETANGDGKLDVNKEYVGLSPTFWTVAHIGQLVTFDEGGSNKTILDRFDVAVIVDLLIQECY